MPLEMSSIRQVVFQGGGGKGIAYLGALRALQRRLPKFATGGSFDPITGIGGASAGAITAFLVSCGFPLDGEKQSISKYARNSDFSSLLKQIKPSLSRVVKKNGVPFNKGGQSSIPTIGMPSPRPTRQSIHR